MCVCFFGCLSIHFSLTSVNNSWVNWYLGVTVWKTKYNVLFSSYTTRLIWQVHYYIISFILFFSKDPLQGPKDVCSQKLLRQIILCNKDRSPHYSKIFWKDIVKTLASSNLFSPYIGSFFSGEAICPCLYLNLRMAGCTCRCRQGLLKLMQSLQRLVSGTLTKGTVAFYSNTDALTTYFTQMCINTVHDFFSSWLYHQYSHEWVYLILYENLWFIWYLTKLQWPGSHDRWV